MLFDSKILLLKKLSLLFISQFKAYMRLKNVSQRRGYMVRKVPKSISYYLNGPFVQLLLRFYNIDVVTVIV